jgi:Bacteriophage baseplate protein W
MIQVAFPYHVGTDGRTASAEYDQHVEQMIEQVLFTAPGERVNRPTFGSGLLQLVFAPNRSELVATLQHIAETSLQQWLRDVIDLQGVEVTSEESTLSVTVKYVVKKTATTRTAQFTRAV